MNVEAFLGRVGKREACPERSRRERRPERQRKPIPVSSRPKQLVVRVAKRRDLVMNEDVLKPDEIPRFVLHYVQDFPRDDR